MATHNTGQLLIWIGVATAAHRNAIEADLFPQPRGLQHLTTETETGIKDAVESYSKRRGGGAFRLPRVQHKRLVSLMHWAKDQQRSGDVYTFPDTTTEDQFLSALEEAHDREVRRVDQKKIGENLLSADFQIKLKGSTQWIRWRDELTSVLGSIIGATGVPLTYVIRENGARQPNGHPDWETKVIHCAALTGMNFRHDAKTVHQIILKNISEESDAYTYIKPFLRHEDGRRDIVALRGRYENVSSLETRVNEAKQLFDSLQYRNERHMPFEQFVAKFHRAVDELEMGGRPMHNLDIVDAMWGKIVCPELKGFLDALKVAQIRTPRGYADLLQDIATEIPNLVSSSKFRSNVSEITSVTSFTRDGTAPTDGVMTSDGKLFIGNYTTAQWRSDSVREHHDTIQAVRKANPNPHPKGSKPYKSAIKNKKKKLAKLKATVADLKVKKAKLAAVVSEKTAKQEEASEDEAHDQAGTSFGGKTAKSKTKS